MRNNHNYTKDLNIQISILNNHDTNIKTITIPVDDYIEKITCKKCKHPIDDHITDMLKNIYQQKEKQSQ